MRSPEQLRKIPFKQLAGATALLTLLMASVGCEAEASFQTIRFPDCNTDPHTKTQSKTLDFYNNPQTIEIDNVVFWMSQSNPVKITIFPKERVRIDGNHRIFEGRDGRTYDVVLGKQEEKDSSAQVPLTITASCTIN